MALNARSLVPESRRQDLEDRASEHWDGFYSVHENRFFKDRNWLFTELPELAHLRTEEGCDCCARGRQACLMDKCF